MSGHLGPVLCEPSIPTLAGRSCFVARWRPVGPPRGAAMLLQPFGDEAHLTRRTHRLIAERLAAGGIDVWQADPSGTGDSEGDFVDASLARWREELVDLADTMRAHGHARAVVIGGRFGARLALDLAAQRSEWARRLVLWAPVLDGPSLLGPYLRLLSVGGRHDDGPSDARQVRAEWSAGRSVRIAGLDFGAVLGGELDALPSASVGPGSDVVCIDVRAIPEDEPIEPSPSTARAAARWVAAGASVRTDAIRGPGFWNVPDPVDCLDLVDAVARATTEGTP